MFTRCPSESYYCCDETARLKQLWEERIHLAYSSISLFITKESQERNSNKAENLSQDLM